MIEKYADGTAIDFSYVGGQQAVFDMKLSQATARDFLAKLNGGER